VRGSPVFLMRSSRGNSSAVGHSCVENKGHPYVFVLFFDFKRSANGAKRVLQIVSVDSSQGSGSALKDNRFRSIASPLRHCGWISRSVPSKVVSISAVPPGKVAAAGEFSHDATDPVARDRTSRVRCHSAAARSMNCLGSSKLSGPDDSVTFVWRDTPIRKRRLSPNAVTAHMVIPWPVHHVATHVSATMPPRISKRSWTIAWGTKNTHWRGHRWPFGCLLSPCKLGQANTRPKKRP